MTGAAPSKWVPTPREALRLQVRLRGRARAVRLRWRGLERVAGCDVAAGRDRLWAAVVVFRYPELELIEEATAELPLTFPYVPGLLSFRELPVLLEAFGRLARRPGVVLCDGQGRAHPRRFGLATHLGVALDLPTIGCAKSRLIGEHDEVGPRAGNWTPLRDGREVVGAVLRTRDGVRPLYVSVGHRTTLPDAIRLTLACGAGFRLPEPTRQADQLAGRLKRARLALRPRTSSNAPQR